jgi:hypothetical protein
MPDMFLKRVEVPRGHQRAALTPLEAEVEPPRRQLINPGRVWAVRIKSRKEAEPNMKRHRAQARNRGLRRGASAHDRPKVTNATASTANA